MIYQNLHRMNFSIFSRGLLVSDAVSVDSSGITSQKTVTPHGRPWDIPLILLRLQYDVLSTVQLRTLTGLLVHSEQQNYVPKMFLSPYWKSCNRTPDDITGVADHFRVLAVVLLLFAPIHHSYSRPMSTYERQQRGWVTWRQTWQSLWPRSASKRCCTSHCNWSHVCICRTASKTGGYCSEENRYVSSTLGNFSVV